MWCPLTIGARTSGRKFSENDQRGYQYQILIPILSSLNSLAQFHCDTIWLPKWFWTTVQNSIWNTIDDFTLIQLHQTYFQKTTHIFSSFFAFIEIFLSFSCIHANHVNSTGSVSKTNNTWWKYQYLPPTCKYRYLVLVFCPSLSQYTLSSTPKVYKMHTECFVYKILHV